MARFLLFRILGVVPQLFLISILAFLIMKAAPGDPVASLVGGREYMSQADYERVAHNLGLDRSLPVQYGMWLNRMVRGDWGKSLRDGREIRGIVLQGLQATLLLVSCSWVFMALLAIAAGYWAGTRPHSGTDYTLSSMALLSFATPAFWLGLLFILIFSVWLDLLPSAGQTRLGYENSLADQVQHLILPVSTVVLTHVGPYIRLVRGSIQDTLSADFIRAAKARGLKKTTIIRRYLVPNALTPFITWVGFSFPLLVGGIFIVEWVFGWPGLGRLFLQAAMGRNYPLLMASVIMTGILVIVGNLLADLLVAWLNPKLRRGNGR